MAQTVSSDSVAQDQLRAFIERIERMEEEKKAIADDIREIYAEAKGNGFDVKVLRQICRHRMEGGMAAAGWGGAPSSESLAHPRPRSLPSRGEGGDAAPLRTAAGLLS